MTMESTKTSERKLTLRIDCDYGYSSRFKSALCTFFDIKFGSDYLKNCKIVAGMINASPLDINAFWFFTRATVPDAELLELLNNDKHVVGVHVVTGVAEDIRNFEAKTGLTVKIFNYHGISNILSRIIWRRFRQIEQLSEFEGAKFFEYPKFGIDITWNENEVLDCVENLGNRYIHGRLNSLYSIPTRALHLHPIWLFQQGRINRRGAFFNVFRKILQVDEQFDAIVKKGRIVKKARYADELERNLTVSEDFLSKLGKVDLFEIAERGWGRKIVPRKGWRCEEDNVGLLEISTYDEWFRAVGKKTRNLINKSVLNDVETRIVEPSREFVEGINAIYNETPIRQGRRFNHYGESVEQTSTSFPKTNKNIYVGACKDGKLIGFANILIGEDDTAIIAHILSFQKYFDVSPNNALMAKIVNVCAERKIKFLIYGRFGNHPSLDRFKENNGFVRFPLRRFFIPLTTKGKIAIVFRIHKELKERVPKRLKSVAIKVFDGVSRLKAITKT